MTDECILRIFAYLWTYWDDFPSQAWLIPDFFLNEKLVSYKQHLKFAKAVNNKFGCLMIYWNIQVFILKLKTWQPACENVEEK